MGMGYRIPFAAHPRTETANHNGVEYRILLESAL